MVRQFRLYGLDTNTEIDLNDFVTNTDINKRSWYLLTLPNGLGFEFNNTYVKVGSQRIRVAQEQKYNTITGIIEVCGKTRNDWELNYNILRDFIAKNKNKGFKLYYKNVDNKERYILCDVKIISKSEKNSYCIPVVVEFETKTLWLDDQDASYTIKVDEIKPNMYAFMKDDNFSDAWHYNYGYLKDLNYDIKGTYTDDNGITYEVDDQWSHNIYYMPQNIGQVILTNSSDAETPLRLDIYGQCKDPEIQILDNNNVVIQKCKIYANVELGERLVINSDPNNLFIMIVKGDSGNSEIKTFNTDLGKDYRSFLTLPIGEYTMKIIDGRGNNVQANIKYSLQYLGG